MSVNSNTTFCEDTYSLSSGISIGLANIDLNCNNATLIGTGGDDGIYNEGYDYVTIENCNIKNYSNGIYLYGYIYDGEGIGASNDNLIRNNLLEENNYGIYSRGPWDNYKAKQYYNSRHIFYNNTLENNNYGVRLDATTSMNITENMFEENARGIYLGKSLSSWEGCSNNNIFNNLIRNNSDYGIYITSSNNNLVYNNSFEDTGIFYTTTNNEYCLNDQDPNQYSNGAEGPPCDCLLALNGLSVNSNTTFCEDIYSLSSGISIGLADITLDCNNSTLIGTGGDDGIYNEGYDYVTIENCNIKNYSNGIYLYGYMYRDEGIGASNDNLIHNNLLEENNYGIYSKGPRDSYEAKQYYNSKHIFYNNTLENNNYGIRLDSSNSMNITENTIEDNEGIGIYLGKYSSSWGGCSSNNIFNNSIKNNSNYGLYITSSDNNDIFENYFLNNSVQASDSGSNNQWNFSELGNWWSDYDSESEGCFDFELDRVCDNPYGNISGSSGSVDYFPYALPGCDFPYGSSYEEGCDCNFDSDCSEGYFCEIVSGPDACVRDNSCSGNVQIITETSSGEGVDDVNVYLNGSLIGVTNYGFYSLDVVNETCGLAQRVDVTCSDGSFCSNGRFSIDYDGEEESLVFDCTMCEGDGDLFISQEEVVVVRDGDDGMVKVNVSSINLNASNLDVEFNIIGFDGYVQDADVIEVDILSNSESEVSYNFSSFDDVLYVAVYVDPDNDFEETKTNNFVRKIVKERTNAHFDIDTGYSLVNDEIEDFLKLYYNLVGESEADLVISVGRKSEGVMNEIVIGEERNCSDGSWGYENDYICFNGLWVDEPYVGVVGFEEGSKDRIYVFGNDVDGTIAALKKFVAAGNSWFNVEDNPALVVDSYDLTGIQVYDFLHNFENKLNYKQNNEQFAEAVSKILNGNSYDVAIRLVETQNVNSVKLRLKDVNSDFSEEYKDAILVDDMPIVFGGGLWSNLETWEKDDGLALQMAQEGYDTWEIEMTGGELSECDTCPDYTYDDVVDYHFPALVGAVQYYTDKNTIKYVGHSNGCRVPLSSLNKYQESGKVNVGVLQDLITGNDVNVSLLGSVAAPVVDTFVGVACPGTLNGDTFLSMVSRKDIGLGRQVGDVVMDRIDESHITLSDYTDAAAISMIYDLEIETPVEDVFDATTAMALMGLGKVAQSTIGDTKISKNLMWHYNNISGEEDTVFDLSNFTVRKLRLYYSRLAVGISHDSVVPLSDMDLILNDINISDKDGDSTFFSLHTTIKNKGEVKELIKEELKS